MKKIMIKIKQNKKKNKMNNNNNKQMTNLKKII